MLVAGNRVFDTLTVEERAWMQFRALVSLFIHDGLKRGDPADTMGEFFAQWQFGEGLKPDNVPALLAPFFGPADSLLTSRSMTAWKPYMEMTIKYDAAGNRIRNWYSLRDILSAMPWLADPDATMPRDKNVYWLRDLKNKRGGVTDYCDSFRLFCRWLLYTSAADIAAKFPKLVMSGQPGGVERLDQIAEALKIFSLDDWILLKKNKGFRNVADQFKARRQYEKGKTEVFQYMKEWAATREEVLGSGYMQLQDLLAVDKPTGTEGTQGYRLDFYEWSEAQKLNLVFIFEFPDLTDTTGLVGDELARAQLNNRNHTVAHWAKLVALLRLAGIRSDINDPMSGEEIDRAARFYPNTTVWPYTASGPISPVWSTIIRTGFKVNWDAAANVWIYTPREGTATSKPLPQEEQDFLWDWFRTLIRDRADEVQERIWMKDLDLPSGVVSIEDIEKAVGKGYFAGLRAQQCYVFAVEPVRGLDPSPLRTDRLREGMMDLKDARALRDAWGAANVVWIRGYSPLPNHGLAHWREVAWNFFDLGMLGDTEVMDARAWKMQACKTLLSYHDTRILSCRHEYTETCNGSGNGCEGWLKGQSPIEWFFFQQMKLIAKPIALAWISPHGDKQKWEQLVSLLNYPDKEKDSEKYDTFWLEKIMSGRPIEWIFDRTKKGISALWQKLSRGKADKIPWELIDEVRKSYEKRWSQLVKGLAGYAQKAFNHRTPGLEWEYEKVVAIMAQGSKHAWAEAERGLEGQFVSTY